MRSALLIVGMLVLTVSALADTGAETPKAYSQDVLKWHDCLDFVRHGKHEAHFNSPCFPGDPAVLIGLTRTDVHVLFGEPISCRDATDDGDGTDIECGQAGQWWYSFYTLPEGYVGGGPELALVFGRDDRVVHTRWFMTQ